MWRKLKGFFGPAVQVEGLPRERDQVDSAAAEFVQGMRALGASPERVVDRLRQARMLEAVGASDAVVETICKVSAQGRVTAWDLSRLESALRGGGSGV